MSSVENRHTKSCKNHTFKDFCNVSEHIRAFVASHLNNPVRGAELYKESYSKEKVTYDHLINLCLDKNYQRCSCCVS